MSNTILQISKNKNGVYDIPNCLCFTCNDSVPKNPQFYSLIDNKFYHGNKKYVKYNGWYYVTKKGYRRVLIKK
jgi:hypothetical protein